MSRPTTHNPFSGSNMNTGAGGSSASHSRSGNAGEWGRSTNGPNGFGHSSRGANIQTPTRSTGAYVPPHAAQTSRHSRDENAKGRTYTLDEMLQVRTEVPKTVKTELKMVFNMGHVPGQSASSSSAWGRREEDTEQASGVNSCYNPERNTRPTLLTPMTQEETEMFTSSVNSTAHKNRHDYKEGTGYNRNKMSRTQASETPTTPNFTNSKFRRRNTGEDGSHDAPSSFSRGDGKERSNISAGTARTLSRWTAEDPVASPATEAPPTDLFGKLDNRESLTSIVDTKTTQSPWSSDLRTAPRTADTPLSRLALDDFSTQSPQQGSQRPTWNSARSESRFKNLMSQASIDDIQSPRRQQSKLDVLNEGSSFDDSQDHAQKPGFFDEPGLIDMNRFGNTEEHSDRSGRQTLRHLPGSIGWNQSPHDMASQHLQRRDTNEHYATPPHKWHSERGPEPMSPTTTNPYQSSETDLTRLRDSSSQRQNAPGLESQYHAGRNPALQQGFPVPSRSQTSSVGPPRLGMPSNGFDNGFGIRDSGISHSPWHMPPSNHRDPFAMQTPDRPFQPFGETQGFHAAPNSFRDPNGAYGSGDRINRLEEIFNDRSHDSYQAHGSPFPRTAMHDQHFPSSRPSQYSPAHGFARMEPNLSARASPAQGIRPEQQVRSSPQSTNPRQVSPGMNTGNLELGQYSNRSDPHESLPPNQRMNLLYPDQTAWTYEDSKGNVQGPYSGLVMHEWYIKKEITNELLIRLDESSEFQSLGEYIRKIGNSKEPFLVPVVGVSSKPTEELNSINPNASGVIRPPFAGAFPVFGTTLSAVKQNQLEEEKQNASLLMARQRVDLNMKLRERGIGNFGPGNQFGSPSYGPGQGPSLAQMGPSYPPGRVDFPFDQQHQAMRGPGPIGPPRLSMVSEPMNRPDLESLSAVEREIALEEEARELQKRQSLSEEELRRKASLGGLHDDPTRLQEFLNLRSGELPNSPPRAQQAPYTKRASIPVSEAESSSHVHPVSAKQAVVEAPSKDIQQLRLQTESPEVTESDLTTRGARNPVLEGMAAESRESMTTPVVETPSSALAPWARDQSEGPKGPSLKEIQDAEARKAAKQQEIVNAARRAALEQETLLAAQVAAASPVVSLPTSAQWATASPVVSAAPAWAHQSSATAAAINKNNSIAAIQKEQENRKNKAAAALAAASTSVPGGSVAGKRYAELASKVSMPTPAASSAAGWATVGSNGKAKTPISVVPPRAVSSGAPTTPITKPKLATSSSSSAVVANEQFQKWVKASLSRGLNSGINVDGFIKDLLSFPQELDILSEAIYASSASLDGRRFAEEFIKRRKQADKGIAPEPAASTSFMSGDSKTEANTNGNTGWNEVAKKKVTGATEKEDASAGGAFKVIAKKKGKR